MSLRGWMRLQIDWRQNITFHIIMSFRKPCHMPFRKLIPPFTITARCRRSRSFVRSLLTSGKRHPSWELNLRKRVVENRNKNALYLSVNVFSTKVLIGDTIFYVSNWRRDRHFTWSSEPREGLAACTAKGVTSFLSYFKTLSDGPPRVIEPARYPSLQSSALPTELILPRSQARKCALWWSRELNWLYKYW